MADKVLKVVIDGEEYVSVAAKQAEGGLAGFAAQLPGWAKALAVFAIGFDTLRDAVGRVAEFAVDSMRAFDEYVSSQRRMEAQAKITGVPLRELAAVAKTAREEFLMGTTAANDAAVTVAKYATRAGDASRANELLAAALDLGRASGLGAAEAMQALEMGLRGQDEGFDKLLGKNPSTIWKEYADANGLAVGKMTDTQKRMAELTAVIEAGNKVTGAYAEGLETGAGAQERMNNTLEEGKVRFGQAIEPLRVLVLRGLAAFIDVAAPVVVWAGRVANAIGVGLVGGFNAAQLAVGKVVQGFGALIGNDRLRDWGREYAEAATRDMQAIVKAVGDASTATELRLGQTAAAVEAAADRQATAVEQSTERQERAARRAADAQAQETARTEEALRSLSRNVELTTTGLERLGARASIALPPGVAAEFNAKMAEAAQQVGEIRANVAPVPQSIADASREIVGVARGALDAAQAFGVIDRNAAAALGSAISIGEQIARMASSGFTFAGVTGVLGGVANIVSTLVGGDAERRRLLRQNSEQLERLRTEGIAGLTVSGAGLANARDVLAQVLGNLGNISGRLLDPAGALRAAGLSMQQLDLIAREMGITIRDRDGKLMTDALRQLLAALQGLGTGAGQGFAAQLAELRRSFEIQGTGQRDQTRALADLVAKFSPALRGVVDVNDTAGSITRLQNLAAALRSGALSLSDLGGLTRDQFSDMILELIRGLRADGEAPGGSATAPPGTRPAPGDTAPLPPEVAKDLTTAITDMHDALATALRESIALEARTADATEASARSLQVIEQAVVNISLPGVTGAADAQALADQLSQILRDVQDRNRQFRGDPGTF